MNASVLEEIRARRANCSTAGAADEILCDGPLKKQSSGLFGGFNSRWFRLTNAGLFYFHDASKAPQPGDNATAIDISEGKYFRIFKSIEYAIEIVVGGKTDRTWILQASSVEERNKWLKSLSNWQKGQRNANNDEPSGLVRRASVAAAFYDPAIDEIVSAIRHLPESQANTVRALLQCDFKHAVAGARALTAQKSSRDLDRLLAAYLHVAELARASVPFLSACVRAEVDATDIEILLYRASSITNRLCTNYMRQHGHSWLQAVLQQPALELTNSELSVEVDAKQVGVNESLAQNLNNLQIFAQMFLDSIWASTASAKPSIRFLAAELKRRVSSKFPHAGHAAVGNLIFVRYLCPALLAPDQYRFMDNNPKRTSVMTTRRFALVARLLQCLVTCSLLNDDDAMSPLNEFLAANFDRMRAFIDEFVTPPEDSDFIEMEGAPRDVTSSEAAACVEDLDLIRAQLSTALNVNFDAYPAGSEFKSDVAMVALLRRSSAHALQIVSPSSSSSAAAAATASSSSLSLSTSPSSSSSASTPAASSSSSSSSSAFSFSPKGSLSSQSDVFSFIDPIYKSTVSALFDNDHKQAVAIAKQLTASKEAKEIERVATALLNVMEVTNSTVSFLAAIIQEEVFSTDSEGTLFRSTSIGSRMLANFMKLYAGSWLKGALKEPLDRILADNSPYEVDGFKLGANDDLKVNQENLARQAEWLIEGMFKSIALAKPEVREVARLLQILVCNKFPSARYSAVGGLLILRYLCPALLAPEQHDLIDESKIAIRKASTRRYVLLAKIIQNLSNGVPFGGKEEYMCVFNALLDKHAPSFKAFVDEFVTPPKGSGGSFVGEFRVVTKAEVDCIEIDLIELKKFLQT